MHPYFTLSYVDKFRDLAPLVLRLATGAVFIAHGYPKLMGGVDGVAGFLGQLGFPLPELFAVILIAVELGGGILLILGLMTRWVAKFLVVVSAVALFLVHLPDGVATAFGEYEFVLLLLAACVSLVITGAGKYSLDRALLKA